MRKILLALMAFVALFVVAGCRHRPFYEQAEPTPLRSNVHTTERPVYNAPEPEAAPQPRRRLFSLSRRKYRQQRQVQTVQQPPQTRVLAMHETEFDTSEENRNTNIALAVQSINGKIVQPGETFSYNEAVGPTIEERGYKKSTVYANGVKKENFGGGVCQVSTTLHNAAKEAGMEIIERHDHSLPVTYAESGEEAATSYGVIDFKFKNNQQHPIKIVSSVSEGKIRATIESV